jgi:acyl dehydratase
MEGIRWLKPVRTGDSLSVTAEVTEAQAAKREGGRNLIKLLFTAVNQNGEAVIEINSVHFVKGRPQ